MIFADAAAGLACVLCIACVAVTVPTRKAFRIDKVTFGRVYADEPRTDFWNGVLALLQSALSLYLAASLTLGTALENVGQILAYALTLGTALFLVRQTVGAGLVLLHSVIFSLRLMSVLAALAAIAVALVLWQETSARNQVFLNRVDGDTAAQFSVCNDQGTHCYQDWYWEVSRFSGSVDASFSVEIVNSNPLEKARAELSLEIPRGSCTFSWVVTVDGKRVNAGNGLSGTTEHFYVPLKESRLRLVLKWSKAASCAGRVTLSND